MIFHIAFRVQLYGFQLVCYRLEVHFVFYEMISHLFKYGLDKGFLSIKKDLINFAEKKVYTSVCSIKLQRQLKNYRKISKPEVIKQK